MTWQTVFTILVLIVLGDGVAAVFGMRSCVLVWRKVGVSSYTRQLSLFLALFMLVMALVGMSEIVNSVLHGKILVTCQPFAHQVQGIIGRIARSAVTWAVAWKLTQVPKVTMPFPKLPQ